METYNFLDCGIRETFDLEPSELERVGWFSSRSRSAEEDAEEEEQQPPGKGAIKGIKEAP